MNNGQIGSYYDNAYLNYDAGKLTQQSEPQAGVAETAKINLHAADSAVVQASDSVFAAQDMTAGQFVSNALKEAGITQSDKTMQLVQTLLSQQQPVDKNTLNMFNRLIKMFPDTDVQTIVHMKLNNIPVNKEMITQYEQYRSNANYIMKDLAAIADGFGDVLKSLNMSTGKEAAVAQLKSIVTLVKNMTDSTGSIDEVGNHVQQLQGKGSLEEAIIEQPQPENVKNPGQGENVVGVGADSAVHTEMNLKQAGQALTQSGEQVQTADKSPDGMLRQEHIGRSGQVNLSDSMGGIQSDNTGVAKQSLQDATLNILGELTQEASALAREEKKPDGTFLEKLTAALEQMTAGTEDELFKLLDKDDIKKAVKGELEQALLLEPKDAAELEKVQKYYKKLKGALDNYIGMSEKQTEAVSYNINKTFQNMSENLNFMHYVNEMMPYIQLPLKLLDENAHGDFYVMRNKKNKTENQDEFTAFLRLDMEHLGGLDVFIKLKKSVADISFKAESSEICEFIKKNFEQLERGLESKGYNLTAHVEKKEEEFSFVKDIIEGEKSGIIEKYSFDMMM